ncbi:AfsA-related hotdog domain-containing protein [Marinomonas sp. RSW2]|uniref:AfsA-related hotdog domain-containing protein n=1 Tax=Marinomonas maritima TaxID=2940935 RepID=A0ABT5WF81_9GAMM|nr:AfsA-related hotdog domain-containing protein [Marinomonas maritima]MDE8603478.1 AfsA-related hotdog domain-containing protein [Marinomonas maritima]
MNKKFIVGNCFTRFAQGANIVLLDQFKLLLQSGDIDPSVNYWVGQGITASDIHDLNALHINLKSVLSGTDFVLKDHHIAHKRRPENCHISVPVKLSEGKYQMNVVIDPNCAELNDHITGEHINGTILMEAVRQSCIGVTERFFITGNKSPYFILKEMNSVYSSFLFPLPITMDYTIISHEIKGNYQTEFEIEATMYHVVSEPACKIKAVFSTYEKAPMEEFEQVMAADSPALFK